STHRPAATPTSTPLLRPPPAGPPVRAVLYATHGGPPMVAWLVAVALSGCASAPVFNGIAEGTVHKQTAAGIHEEKLEGEKLQKVRNCLYSTTEVPAAESK